MKKLLVSSGSLLRLIPHQEIVFCKSDNYYTSFFLNNGEELIVCRSLRKVQDELDESTFLRVSQSYLINKNFIYIIDKKNKLISLTTNYKVPFTTTLQELILAISK